MSDRPLSILQVEADHARRDALSSIERAEAHLRDLRAQIMAENPVSTYSGEPVRAMAEAVTYAQRYSVAIRAVRLLEIDAAGDKRAAYEDAARIVLEPRGGIEPTLAKLIAERIVHRADGLGEPGDGVLPHERLFRVYKDSKRSGGAAAIKTVDHLGREGLLTLEEARHVRAKVPGTWIGRPGGKVIQRVEG